ncbi:MAG: bifunctional folylpolyglutamate synthase/dihydrofolate synthase [Planctomyces sp.]|nr:bifunctional folylpolyglutamate synthase/dihydrofolate synthase [Planctomyces sp.]
MMDGTIGHDRPGTPAARRRPPRRTPMTSSKPDNPEPSAHAAQPAAQGGSSRRGPGGAGGAGVRGRAPVRVHAQSPPSPGTAGEISSYAQAQAYLLQGRVNFERTAPRAGDAGRFKLDRTRAILSALGDPHTGFRSVHVAGTKGKGSTCEMIAASLERCGCTVGCYTSPHVLDVRERIRVNRAPVSPERFVGLARAAGLAAESVEAAHGRATFFELITAMGFVCFAQDAVDIAVVEVGLGGLLDCTNVISPLVAAVTLIGLDHTEVLGQTVGQIAAQKGGIFKPGAAALTIEQSEEALGALRRCAQAVGERLAVVGRDVHFAHRFEWPSGGRPLQRVTLKTRRNSFEHMPVPLRGEHQALNCGLALAVLDRLGEHGFVCPPERVQEGLESVRLPGRLEVLPTQPRVALDVAHNPASVAALLKALPANLQYDSLIVVFGCAADKDAPAMVRSLASAADKVIFTQAGGEAAARARPAADLARLFRDAADRQAQTAPDLPSAMSDALRAAQGSDLVLVAGSFYIVAEATTWLRQRGHAAGAGLE